MRHKTFLKSAAVLSLGGLIAKGVGALYRIPLANVLGGYGMGLYQMAYPFFCLLLTFSSAGIPSALSRIIARETAHGRTGGDAVRAALGLFAALGAGGSALMCLFASRMSELQGERALVECYLALAPSVLLVALLAVLRGYFQGKNDMRPTAVSEILEQLFKAAAGLYFASRYAADPVRAVVFSLLAVTGSEAVALLYLAVRYRREPPCRMLSVGKTTGGDVLLSALPVMVAASVLPLSRMADSVLVVRLLSRHTARAVALYGLFTGGAASLASVPATVCCGLVAAAVPAVSRAAAKGDFAEGRRRALSALGFTLALSLPAAAALFVFARPLSALLYPALSPADEEILVRLVRLSALSAATVACVDTLAACLTGMGRAKFAALSMLAAVGVKVALQFLLVSDPAFSVEGAAIAANACYLVAFSLDLFYTVKRNKKEERAYDNDRRAGNGEGGFDGAREGDALARGQGAPAHRDAPLGRGVARGGDPV